MQGWQNTDRISVFLTVFHPKTQRSPKERGGHDGQNPFVSTVITSERTGEAGE